MLEGPPPCFAARALGQTGTRSKQEGVLILAAWQLMHGDVASWLSRAGHRASGPWGHSSRAQQEADAQPWTQIYDAGALAAEKMLRRGRVHKYNDRAPWRATSAHASSVYCLLT